ncbi:poly-gamma-glutamate biosynthesis protein PgsC [Fusobacterium sp.]|uniref:poly-gamma-glutamate biosynthesis protein PgsC n=1 Tax=Fusobacterium sp. TaxID=68766 RepID=UPI0026215BA5|nr:poly-gamma-glutamate biosynthesis protein PgsC [Fusobacterium sp.]
MNNEIIILGIVITIIFYEITEISSGGLIVPAYLALYLENSQKVIITLIAAIIVYLIVRIISDRTILYGRRKFAVYIIVGFLVRLFFRKINLYLEEYQIEFLSGNIIGIMITAILARDIERNGMIKSLSLLMIVSIFIKSIIEIIYEIGDFL